MRVITIMVRYLLTSVLQNFDDLKNIKRLSYLNLTINSNEKKKKKLNESLTLPKRLFFKRELIQIHKLINCVSGGHIVHQKQENEAKILMASRNKYLKHLQKESPGRPQQWFYSGSGAENGGEKELFAEEGEREIRKVRRQDKGMHRWSSLPTPIDVSVNQGLSQDLETGCPKWAIVKILGVQNFQGGPQYTQISTINMYKFIRIRHDILIQCHGNNMEIKNNQLYT